MVSPGFFVDDELVQHFDFGGRIFYQGLWCVAEDSGVYEPKLLALKMQIFPGDNIPLETLAGYLNTLIGLGKVVEYTAYGKKLHWLKNFHKHQKVEKPAPPSLPLPPWMTWHGEAELGPQRHKWHYEILPLPADVGEMSGTGPGNGAGTPAPEEKLSEVKLSEVKLSKKNHMCSGAAATRHNDEAAAAVDGDSGANGSGTAPYPAEFETFWQAYPEARRREKQGAFKAWKSTLKQGKAQGITAEKLIAAARNYGAEMAAKGKEPDYIKLPKTFLGPDKPYEDYLKPLPAHGLDPPRAWSKLRKYINPGEVFAHDQG
jgi:hypothetical protein